MPRSLPIEAPRIPILHTCSTGMWIKYHAMLQARKVTAVMIPMTLKNGMSAKNAVTQISSDKAECIKATLTTKPKTITANMQLSTLFALAAHASLIAAGPLAEPVEAKAQQAAVPAGLPTNLPADVKQRVLALVPSANALAKENALPGLGGLTSVLPPLPGVGGAPTAPSTSVAGIPIPNIPVVSTAIGAVPLPPLPVPSIPGGLPVPKALLGKITSAISILQLIVSILGVGGDGARLDLPLGIGAGSGNPVVQLLIGLVLALLSGVGLPALPI
ncbi:MAG: hypothetical protein Q9169_002860 [Polycauliona sp. 2 TL-2023]